MIYRIIFAIPFCTQLSEKGLESLMKHIFFITRYIKENNDCFFENYKNKLFKVMY